MRDDQIKAIFKTLRESLSTRSSDIMNAFHAVDKDRSGYLSIEEFKKVLSNFKINLPPSALQAVMNKFDVNGDGTISYAEFNAIMSGPLDVMTNVHHSSLDALRNAPASQSERPPSRSRPQSAMPRLGTPPANELRRVPTPQQIDDAIKANTPPQRQRPRSAYPTHAKRVIYGEVGPPMDGVIHYPYSSFQRLYRDDFESMVMASITHPFCRTAKANASSLPHNILCGSAFDDGRLNKLQSWVSESDRSYVRKSLVASKTTIPTGVRSECVQFLS